VTTTLQSPLPSRLAARAVRVLVAPGALVATLALLGGCGRSCGDGEGPRASDVDAASVTSTASTSSRSPASAGAGRIATARALALASPEGSSPADADIKRYQQAVSRSPEKADAWTLLGRAWVRKAREAADPGNYLSANACADLVLDMEPENRGALDLRGLVLLNDHKFSEARDLTAELLTKAPDDILALATLSDALLELGRYDEALEAAQKMNDLKPGLPAYSRASYLRWLRGDVAGAKEVARKAIDAHDPRDLEPWAWVTVQAAMIFWHEGNYKEAGKGFEMALGAVPDYPPALVGKGRVALAAGEAAAAAALFERAYKASPLAETAWLLGDARAAAGSAAGADEAYAEVERRGRAGDGRTLALFYATKNRSPEEARRLAETERKTRDDLYTEDAYAFALYRKGELAEARAAIDKATALGTPDARLLYHAGAIRIAAGDTAGGEKLVREALAKNPKFDLTSAAEAASLLSHGARAGQ
jgi:tetratricopeptide (TPR) repeat protein